MRQIVLLGTLVLAVGVSIACSGESSPIAADGADSGDGDPEAGAPAVPSDAGADIVVAPPNTSGMGAGTGANTGLPCDVQQLLENRCVGCHGGTLPPPFPPPFPPPLLTYADLTAKSSSDPTKTMAEVAALRLTSTTRPMPPPPAAPPDADEIKVFEDWVAAGTPMGTVCTDTPADGGAVAGDAGYGAPSNCTSKATWAGGNTGSPDMRPGGACLTCHQQLGGPKFSLAGTVYPTAHEPDDCNGKGPPPILTIVVTDKNNKVTNLPVGLVGNFANVGKVLAPFHVKVTDGITTRAMAGSLTAGDCNSCHTETGANGAPGRIMSP